MIEIQRYIDGQRDRDRQIYVLRERQIQRDREKNIYINRKIDREKEVERYIDMDCSKVRGR